MQVYLSIRSDADLGPLLKSATIRAGRVPESLQVFNHRVTAVTKLSPPANDFSRFG